MRYNLAMGRKRKSENRDLEPNLYPPAPGNRSYRYRRPTDGKFITVGVDRARANRIAQRANAELMPPAYTQEAALLKRALGIEQDITLTKTIQRYIDERLPELELSASYDKEVRRMLAIWSTALGDWPLSTVSIAAIAQVLDANPPNTSNKLRARLIQLYKFAIAKGLTEHNPAEATLRKTDKPQVARLTLAQWQAVHSAALEQNMAWLCNAMQIALHTLQRRSDISAMQFSHVEQNHLFVSQSKVERYGYGLLAIQITPVLAKIIETCRDDVASPYLVHRIPMRRRADYARSKGHPTYVTPDMLSRGFETLRDQLKLHADISKENRPGFGQIRPLGAHLYEKQGMDPGPLLGHASSSMTKRYLERHEARYAVVPAGLDIEKLA